MDIQSSKDTSSNFRFKNMQFSLNRSYKRFTLYPTPFRGIDFFTSNLSQPAAVCGGCFPESENTNSCDYVDLFEFSSYGGIPHPLATGVFPPSRWAADIRYTWNTPIPHQYPTVHKDVLSSKRVISAISSQCKETGNSERLIREKAAGFFAEVHATLSKVVCRVCGYLLFKVFRRLMRRLLVNPAQLKAVKEAEDSDIPIVYLPLHKSHLDYLLITWCNWHFGLRLPHIASGDNLNLSGFGWLLRSTGAFFIRRRLDASDESGKDVLYRTVLRSYLEQLLHKGLPIEFFLEGTRSRFGKPLLPKNGLISNVVEAVQQAVIPDVYLVPVSYTYDQVVEGVFLNELMGIPKQRESIWGVVKGIWKGFGVSERCGSVRMHYGKPVLLSEYLYALSSSLQKSSPDSQVVRQLDRIPHSFSYRELVPWTQKSIENNRVLIRAIGYHVVYDAQQMCSLSPVSIVSTLLLCKYRNGVGMDELAADTQWLCELILSQGKGGEIMGWRRGETSGKAIVEYALDFLRDSVTVVNDRVDVTSSHRQLIHLAYSKNALIPRFAIRSAVALSISSSPCDEPMMMDTVVEKTLQLCEWMQNEVIFCKPCESLRDCIRNTLGQSDMSNRFIGQLSIESDQFGQGDGEENERIEITSSQNADIILFFSHILRPFIQSLYIVLYRLHNQNEKIRETDFIRDLIKQTITMTPSQLPFDLMLECVNSDSVKNCLRVLREKGMISGENEPVYSSHPQKIADSLQQIEHFLEIS